MKLKGKAKAAFLRRMARGRNKRTKRRRTRKKGHHTMARKRRRSVSRGRKRSSGGRRRGGRRRRRSGGLFGGGGGGYALKPGGEDLKLWGAMAGVGWLESKAKTDDSFFANKVPKPVDALGWTGNMAIALWGGSYLLKNRWLRLGARAAAGITAYQLGRKGGTFNSGKDFFVVSGYDDDDVRQMLDASLGALQADGGGGNDGISWDEAAEDAMAMVGGFE